MSLLYNGNDALLVLRFTGSGRHKKFYMDYNSYIKALYDLQRFIERTFLINQIPGDMMFEPGDELAKLYKMNSKARTILYRVFRNLKEFSSLGYVSLTGSEWVHGAVPIPNAELRKRMAKLAHIYLRDLSRYETYHDMRESKAGIRAYRYMHKHRITPETVEFFNYPNKDELRKLGYVEVPSIKCLNAIARNRMSDQSYNGYHKTSEYELIEMLLRNTYAAIVHNSLVDIRENQDITFTCDDIGQCLVNIFNEYTGAYGMPNLQISRRMVNLIGVEPVNNQDELRECIDTAGIVVRFVALIEQVKKDRLPDQIPNYRISYDPELIRTIEDFMQEKFPELINTFKVFEGASFYASEFLF